MGRRQGKTPAKDADAWRRRRYGVSDMVCLWSPNGRREIDEIVLYLHQEGRGIGLMEKLKAYNLQGEGLDTVDANLAHGHQADARSYEVAAGMLQDLGVDRIRLMTNNPAKVSELANAGRMPDGGGACECRTVAGESGATPLPSTHRLLPRCGIKPLSRGNSRRPRP